MRICIAGDTGLLGQALVRRLAARHRVFGFSRSAAIRSRLHGGRYRHRRCDAVARFGKLEPELAEFQPEIVFNCIALADVGACERERAKARRLNVEFAGELARWCALHGVRMVHISTDQIFDGKKRTPYRETDTPRPCNVYARTKLESERAVLKHLPKTLIVRTNIIGFRGRRGSPTFAEWLCRSLRNRASITLAEDFVTSSIHVDSLARLLERAARLRLSGVYHVATRDSASKFELGSRLARHLKLDFSNVLRGRLKELRLKPQRPAYLALHSGKAGRTLGRLPRITDTVRRLAVDYRGRYGGRS